MSAGRVLVVEDEESLRSMLEAALRYSGFETVSAEGGREALDLAAVDQPDVIVLDVTLPDLDGFEVCRRLKAAGSDVPIVFLSGRASTEDKVHGLTIGADDYVTKPFSLDELVARLSTVLRRNGCTRRGARLVCADLAMDDDAHLVTRAGAEVELTPTEYALLRHLLVNQGRVLSKAQLLDAVWGYDFGGDGRVVETYIRYLRNKLDTAEPALIHTVRGIGYCLRPPR
ncbi:MAG: response regulator transcription factor [Ilumatobacteraceae bacterium]